MKYFIVAGLVACLALVTKADFDDLCNVNTHPCSRDECCISDSPNGDGFCKDRGDDPGDPCGGPNFCDCDYGYICEPHPPQSLSRYVGVSNGTCRRDPALLARLQQTRSYYARRRHYYDDDDDDRRRRRR